jgi:hypothetical protein
LHIHGRDQMRTTSVYSEFTGGLPSTFFLEHNIINAATLFLNMYYGHDKADEFKSMDCKVDYSILPDSKLIIATIDFRDFVHDVTPTTHIYSEIANSCPELQEDFNRVMGIANISKYLQSGPSSSIAQRVELIRDRINDFFLQELLNAFSADTLISDDDVMDIDFEDEAHFSHALQKYDARDAASIKIDLKPSADITHTPVDSFGVSADRPPDITTYTVPDNADPALHLRTEPIDYEEYGRDYNTADYSCLYADDKAVHVFQNFTDDVSAELDSDDGILAKFSTNFTDDADTNAAAAITSTRILAKFSKNFNDDKDEYACK